MKLKNFLDKKSISIQQMATDLELPYEYIRRYVNENKIPRPETMAKIVAYTKGKVTANDFYGIEEKRKLSIMNSPLNIFFGTILGLVLNVWLLMPMLPEVSRILTFFAVYGSGYLQGLAKRKGE